MTPRSARASGHAARPHLELRVFTAAERVVVGPRLRQHNGTACAGSQQRSGDLRFNNLSQGAAAGSRPTNRALSTQSGPATAARLTIVAREHHQRLIPHPSALQGVCDVSQIVVQQVDHGVVLLTTLEVGRRRPRKDVRRLGRASTFVVAHEVECVQLRLWHLLRGTRTSSDSQHERTQAMACGSRIGARGVAPLALPWPTVHGLTSGQ